MRHVRGPLLADLARDRHDRPRRGGGPGLRQRRRAGSGRRARCTAGSGPTGVSTLWKTGPSVERHEQQVHAGVAQAGRARRRARPRASTPTTAAVRRPSRAVVSAAYVTPPPSRQPRGSSGVDVAARRADVDDLELRAGHRHLRAYDLRGPRSTRTAAAGVDVFFYELHEGDDEVYSDVLVVSESEWEPDEFFELVQTIRRRIQDTLRARYPQRGDRRRARARPRLHLRQRRPPRRRGQRLDRSRPTTSSPSSRSSSPTREDDDDDDDDDDDEGDGDFRSIARRLRPGRPPELRRRRPRPGREPAAPRPPTC